MTTWTPKTEQSETWVAEAQRPVRAFSPYAFSRRPVFDTGPTSGVWDAKTEQAETWVSR